MRTSKGFTLIELAVVVAIVAIGMAIALPNFWPAIEAMTLEGTARHLGNYGRAVMAQSAMLGEQLIVKIDFEKQEYWTERLPKPESVLKEEEEREKGKTEGELSSDLFSDTEGEVDIEQAEQMAEKMHSRMEQFARQSVESRAANVKHDGMLGDIGPLFEKEFKLDDKKDEQDVEYRNYLLDRTILDQGVTIESVQFGATGKEVAKGIAEIEVFPMGLGTRIIFCLVNGDGEYFTVVWDPITTGRQLYAGKEASL